MSDRRLSVAHPVAAGFMKFAGVAIVCAVAITPMAQGGGRGRGGAGGGGGGGAGTGVFHCGMLHSPLGDATLSFSPDGSLSIDNLGSSGQDGVSIDLGHSQGATVGLRVASGGNVACESITCKMGRVELALAGAGSGTGTVQEFGIVIDDVGGGLASIGPHLLNLTASRTTIVLRIAGETISSTVIDGPPPSQLCTATLGQTGPEGVTISSRAAIRNFTCTFVDGRYVLRAGVPLTFVVGNDPPRLADELEINYSIDSGNNVNWLFGSATIQGRASSGITSIGELEARLQALGILARSIGGAHITGLPTRGVDQDCDLRISNIGSSGQDGVSLDLSSLSSLGVPTNIGINEPIPNVMLDFAQAMDVSSTGTGMQMRLDGVLDDSPNTVELGRISLQPLGGPILVHADMAAMGSTMLDVTALHDGVPTGMVTLPSSSPLGMITPGTLGIPMLSSPGFHRMGNPLVNEVCLPVLDVQFDRVAEFRPLGQAPMQCDELRIAPSAATRSVVRCSTTHLRCASAGGGGSGGSFDIASLRLGPVNGGVERFGVRAMPIGSGISGTTQGIAVSPAPGTTEPFGVAIPLGAAQGAMVTVELPQSTLLPILNRSILKSYFQVGDTPTQDQFSDVIDSYVHRLDDGVTSLEVSVFGFDPIEIQAAARMAGQTVSSKSYGAVLPSFIASIVSPSGSSTVTQGCTLQDVNRNGRPDMLELTFSEPVAFSASLSGGGSGGFVQADEIVLRIKITEVDPIQACAAVCLFDGPSSFSITDVATMQFDLPHRAVGDGRTGSFWCADTPHFVVDNIGSSGQDGVSIDLKRLAGRPANNEVSGFRLDATRSLDDGDIQRFDWTTSGRVDGGSPITVGSASMVAAIVGGDRSITVDQPTWLEQTSVVTRAYLGEQLVDESSGTALGVVAIGVVPIAGTYVFDLLATDALTVSSHGVTHSFRWDTAVDLNVVGMGPVHADRLDVRVVARGTGGNGGGSVALEAMTITGTVATGKLEVGISGETPILHDHCPADINNDSAINVTDLLAVIGGWGACTTCPATMCASDTNRDCSTNVTDLLAVIGGWGACD